MSAPADSDTAGVLCVSAPAGADPVDAASGLMGSDTGRAVGLALSLRERVLQLERRNR